MNRHHAHPREPFVWAIEEPRDPAWQLVTLALVCVVVLVLFLASGR